MNTHFKTMIAISVRFSMGIISEGLSKWINTPWINDGTWIIKATSVHLYKPDGEHLKPVASSLNGLKAILFGIFMRQEDLKALSVLPEALCTMGRQSPSCSEESPLLGKPPVPGQQAWDLHAQQPSLAHQLESQSCF